MLRKKAIVVKNKDFKDLYDVKIGKIRKFKNLGYKNARSVCSAYNNVTKKRASRMK